MYIHLHTEKSLAPLAQPPPPRGADADTSHITAILYQSRVPLTQKGLGSNLPSSSCVFLLSPVFILYYLCFSPILSFSWEQCVEFLLTFLSSLVDFHKARLCKLSIFCLEWFGFLITGLFKSCISHGLSNDFAHIRCRHTWGLACILMGLET